MKVSLSPYKLTFFYISLSALWIISTDKIIFYFFQDASLITEVQTFKGWFFIIVTGIIIYFFLLNYEKQLRDSQEEIIKREKKLNGIFQSDLVGIVITDKKGRIKEANEAFWNLINYPKNIKDITDIIPKDNLKDELLLLDEINHNGKSITREKEIITSANKKISVLTGSVYMENYDEIISFVIDNSLQKKSQKELRKLNNELNVFLYKTSHDLKGPLASITGLAYLALEESNNNNIKNYLNLILKSVHKLDSTLYNIVEIIHIKEEQLLPSQTYLKILIDSLWKSLVGKPNYKSAPLITFNNNIDENLVLFQDPNVLKMIFKSILDNGIKYHNPYVDNPYISIKSETINNECVILIEDNGLGIEDKSRKKIYEMFFRGNSQSQGSGLGLYIVKQALQKIRGSITLTESKHGGCTFKISFPLSSKKNNLLNEYLEETT